MATNVAVVPILLLLLEAAAQPLNVPRGPVDWKTREWLQIKKFSGQFSTKKDPYSVLANQLRNFARGQRFVKQNPVLFKQSKGYQAAPPTLLQQVIEGDGTDRAMLHIRGDNLYIACFANNNGDTFCFNDQHNSYAIPNSKGLTFSSDYPSLVGKAEGGAWKNLIGLKLDKDAVNQAVKVLSTHRETKTAEADIKALKEAVATMSVFVCESTRFPYIRRLVDRAYTYGGGQDKVGEDKVVNKLDQQGAQLVVNWKRISCAILIWYIDQKGWDSEEAKELIAKLGILSIEDALATVGPILYSTSCSVTEL